MSVFLHLGATTRYVDATTRVDVILLLDLDRRLLLLASSGLVLLGLLLRLYAPRPLLVQLRVLLLDLVLTVGGLAATSCTICPQEMKSILA